MADEKKAILLRISGSLAEQLNLWAKDELRSVNAQIEYLLREAVRKRRGGGPTAQAQADEPHDEGNKSTSSTSD